MKQGGATAFPHLDLALWPEEGSAVFWHNLHTSGAYDERTFHGACPVLQGSKWGMLWLSCNFRFHCSLIHFCIRYIDIN